MGSPDLSRRMKAGIFQALAHPTRLFIIEALAKGELTVGSLCELGCISQSNASQHLAILRGKQLVETRKDGNSIFYRLRDSSLASLVQSMETQIMLQATDTLKLLEEERGSMRTTFISSRCHATVPR
jgi:DNA-binding transcriptional ArsR family regulator